MTDLNIENVGLAIAGYYDPHLKEDLISADVVKDIHIDGDAVFVDLEFGYPIKKHKELISEEIKGQIAEIEGVSEIHLHLVGSAKAQKVQKNLKPYEKVKNIIAIISGKGGVGKSTIAMNLSEAIAYEGGKVGVIDADICMPNLHKIFGLKEKISDGNTKKFKPAEKNGIKIISMGAMVDDDTPLLWSGSKASRVVKQFLEETEWGELDYLFIDLPSSFNDVALQVFENMPISGAVVVSTPQDLSIVDIGRTLAALRKYEITPLGFIENMSVHQCSKCGDLDSIYGEVGVKKLANKHGIDIIGSLPFNLSVRESADKGESLIFKDSEYQISRVLREIGLKLIAKLSQQPLHV